MQSLHGVGKMSVYWAFSVCLCFICRSTDCTLMVCDMGDLPLSHRCNCSFCRFSIILLYMKFRFNLFFSSVAHYTKTKLFVILEC